MDMMGDKDKQREMDEIYLMGGTDGSDVHGWDMADKDNSDGRSERME